MNVGIIKIEYYFALFLRAFSFFNGNLTVFSLLLKVKERVGATGVLLYNIIWLRCCSVLSRNLHFLEF